MSRVEPHRTGTDDNTHVPPEYSINSDRRLSDQWCTFSFTHEEAGRGKFLVFSVLFFHPPTNVHHST